MITEVEAALLQLHKDIKEPTAVEMKAFWMKMCADYPKMRFTPRKLQDYMKRKPEFQERVLKLQLGGGRFGRTLGTQRGVKGATLTHSVTNRGVRGPGGGRKNQFEEFWELTKLYTSVERLLGHQLEATDVYQGFVDQVSKRINLHEIKERFASLTPQ